MRLNPPFFINSRLCAAVKFGNGIVSLEWLRRNGDGRDQFRWYVDIDGIGEFTGDDLRSGCGGAGTEEMFATLLTFLGAAAEAYQYSQRGHTSENIDLFPSNVNEWAYQNSDEISLLQTEMEENRGKYIEGD